MVNYRVINSVEECDRRKIGYTPRDDQTEACIRPASDKKRCGVAHILSVRSTE